MQNRKIGMPSFDMTGKSVIVTGGTKGLGFGIAATFAHYGANVCISARTVSDVEDAVKDLNENYAKGGKVIGVPADSGKQSDIDKVIGATVEAFGGLDILVNNAGISGKTAKFLSDECDEANFDKVIATNLKGVFLFAKSAAKQMVAQGRGGKIINMASVGGLVGGPGVMAYGASKAGVISLTKTMANELGRENITVIAVCPGYVVTPLNEDVFLDEQGNHTKVYELSAKNTAVRRLGEIEEIAGPVLALASDCFSYMTGTYIVLDGGQTIGR
ncbi:MAG: SDR family NAD(P)-dependent oxidoreductase [Oscillospiraceae bacterium]